MERATVIEPSLDRAVGALPGDLDAGAIVTVRALGGLAVDPFNVRVSEGALMDLSDRVRRTRWLCPPKARRGSRAPTLATSRVCLRAGRTVSTGGP